MTAELPPHLQAVVETICKTGCQRTNEIIAILDQAGETTEIAQLTGPERMQVMAELRHIMSVYEAK